MPSDWRAFVGCDGYSQPLSCPLRALCDVAMCRQVRGAVRWAPASTQQTLDPSAFVTEGWDFVELEVPAAATHYGRISQRPEPLQEKGGAAEHSAPWPPMGLWVDRTSWQLIRRL
ncbi:MAG: hypothetical protein JWR55_383 [Aeromicrobium sp.]|nr:hypothetical protein [Aeromicrobium sp.]